MNAEGAGWISAWRMIVLGVGLFNIGLAVYMIFAYWVGKIPHGPYRRRAHVLAITLSYVLLTLELCIEIGLRAIRHQPVISYRLGLASIAFPVGTYALLQLIERVRRD